MPTTTFDSIDFSVHERLVHKILSARRPMAIVDSSGKIVWAGSTTSESAIEDLRQGMVPPDTSEPYQARASDEGKVLVHQTLGQANTGTLGWILLVFDTQDPLLQRQRHLSEALADIAHCIRAELSLYVELEDMAGELAQRYEELSLIYLPGETIEKGTQLNRHLEQIVRDCIEYLSVDVAAICIPEMRAQFVDYSPSHAPGEISGEALEQAMGEVFRLISTGARYLVYNGQAHGGGPEALSRIPYKLVACPVFDSQARPYGFVACLRHQDKRDFVIGDRRLMEVIARRADKIIQPWQDTLTGLMSRSWFEDQVELALVEAQQDQKPGAIALFNIDQFEVINDAYGVVAGDDLLKQLAVLLKDGLRGQDTLARVGGNEFGMLLDDCEPDQAYRVIERLRRTIDARSFHVGHRALRTTVSVGLVALETSFDDLSKALTAVDLACQLAKNLGGNRTETFKSDSSVLVRRQSEMQYTGRIDEALAENRFVLFCQPIEPITNGSNHHYEILLRLEDQEGQLLSPDIFMGAAERYNRMPRIDRWVIASAIESISGSKAMLEKQPVCWGINLSGQSLADEGFLDFVAERLGQSGISPEWIYFEITETVAIRNYSQVLQFITRIKNMGHVFALDDFGSGYSSFAYLKNMPVEYVKIDGAFVRNMDTDPYDRVAVSSINQIGHLLGLKTIAEYVETGDILKTLRNVGIDYAQGYAVGRPRPLDMAMRDLAEGKESR